MSIEDADSNGACYASVAEIERLVKDFESCTLPAQEFNHRAHLAVAAWYLAHHTTEEATRLIRRGLQNFLAANGVVTTDTAFLTVSGDMAYGVFIERWWGQFTSRTEPTELMIRATLIFRREDGSWKAVHRHGDNAVAKAPPS